MDKTELERRINLADDLISKGKEYFKKHYQTTDKQWQAIVDNQDKLKAELARFD